VPHDSEELRRLEAETRPETRTRLSPGSIQVPGLTVLYHPDLQRIGERVALPGLASGREEFLSRREPSFSQPGQALVRPLGDPYLSRSPIRLVGDMSGAVVLDCRETSTPIEVDGRPAAGIHELPAAEVERGAVLLLAHRVVLLLSRLDPLPSAVLPDFGLVGESLPVVRLRQEILRASDLAVPVLLRGETGTGKELVARALHEAGPRRTRPFLAVNMGAVPATLAAAELFGAARGSFTGADRARPGYFYRAHGGTLFLDEIGETPAEVQPLLLRALETGEIQPVGGEPQRVDARLIAATDADLEAAAAAGRFRAPLLHRLAGYEVRLPPLRERRDDFGRLLLHFLRQELEAMGEAFRLATPPDGRPWLPAPLVARLAAFSWPGNVRQLRNAARRIAVAGRGAGEVAEGPWIEDLFLDAAAAPGRPAPPRAEPPAEAEKAPRKEYRRPDEVGDEELLAVLRANRWLLKPAAAQLGISRTSLYSKIEKSPHIRKAADLSREEIEECSERFQGDLDAMVEALEVSKRGLQRRLSELGDT
jgi:two-component system nitrogen regulation response regulator GlnG